MRSIKVTEYNDQWGQLFIEESRKLEGIFGEELVKIHHIGSTSVKGLKAKPIIDMMPVVKIIENVDVFNDEMTAIGYEALGENGITGRRFFRKGGDNRTHHIHVFQKNNTEEVDRHLAVRDYLRTHADDAQTYGDLKAELAKQFPYDSESYVNGKDSFVKDLEKKALVWYRK